MNPLAALLKLGVRSPDMAALERARTATKQAWAAARRQARGVSGRA